MDNFYLSNSDIGEILILFVVVYFLFRIGIEALEEPGFWFLILPLLYLGYMKMVNENEIIGFLGFLPVLTYIFMKLFENYNGKIKTVFFGAVGSGAIHIGISAMIVQAGIESVVSALVGGIVFGSSFSG